MNTVFILLTSGFAARNVLQTDIFRTLKQAGLRLVFFVPPGTKGEFKSFEEPGKTIFHEYQYPSALERKLGYFRCLNSFEQAATWKLNTETLNAKREIRKKKNLLRYFFYRLAALLASPGWIEDILRRVDWLLFTKTWIKELFSGYAPSLVYSTDPLFFDELYFLEYAKQNKIKIISQILSWDNLTVRGFLPVLPERLIVWNEIMKDQAKKLYGYRDEQIYISGIPQFDLYFRPEAIPSKADFFRALGADPAKRLVVYLTGAPNNYPSESSLVCQIVKSAMDSGGLGETCQFLIRLNPKDSPERYAALSGFKNVIIMPVASPNVKFRDAWNPGREDILSMAATLKYADVVLNMSSTTVIEAAIFNAPIITVDIDPSLHYFYRFDHYQQVLASGGTRIAKSVTEAVDLVSRYLRNKTLDAAGRDAIVEKQCVFRDGLSAKRIGEYIVSQI